MNIVGFFFCCWEKAQRSAAHSAGVRSCQSLGAPLHATSGAANYCTVPALDPGESPRARSDDSRHCVTLLSRSRCTRKHPGHGCQQDARGARPSGATEATPALSAADCGSRTAGERRCTRPCATWCAPRRCEGGVNSREVSVDSVCVNYDVSTAAQSPASAPPRPATAPRDADAAVPRAGVAHSQQRRLLDLVDGALVTTKRKHRETVTDHHGAW